MLSTDIQYACLAAGKAEGATELNAFDGALLAAGIGDLNLIRVTSIMPRHVSLVDEVPRLERGGFALVVYGARTSSVPGEMLASAVGVGRVHLTGSLLLPVMLFYTGAQSSLTGVL